MYVCVHVYACVHTYTYTMARNQTNSKQNHLSTYFRKSVRKYISISSFSWYNSKSKFLPKTHKIDYFEKTADISEFGMKKQL